MEEEPNQYCLIHSKLKNAIPTKLIQSKLKNENPTEISDYYL